ncbi:site-specific DNA-methyltransferase [Lutibacter sp.]|uniref:site-specific DNA-methyltransferase n=1 Tax=Lutibacter sp. TaxID=1925666 RepID=UPI0034A09D60
MKNIESGSVDCIITDPPYLMNYKSNRRVVKEKFNHIENDTNENFIVEYIKECFRILKDNSGFYCFCSWHKIDLFKQEIEKHFKIKNIIVWNKNNHGTGDLKGSYAPKHEFIIFAHKGRALNKNKRFTDVIDCKKINSQDLTHPTEKPQELLEIFILNNTDENELVFDGCMGTGSLGIACKKLGRDFMGIELDKEYFKIAEERINSSKSS